MREACLTLAWSRIFGLISFTSELGITFLRPRYADMIGASLSGVRGRATLFDNSLILSMQRGLMVFQGDAVPFLFDILGHLVLGGVASHVFMFGLELVASPSQLLFFFLTSLYGVSPPLHII